MKKQSDGEPVSPGGLTRAPRQTRSERSLQRILDATERILETKDFAEVTVNEIVREARSSVGVFYSRFPDKMALLHVLDERFVAAVEADVEEFVRQHREAPLAEAVTELVRFVWRTYTRRKGMQRSLILRVRLSPNDRFQAAGRRLVRCIDTVCDLLRERRAEIRHPDPACALRLGMTLVVAAVKEMVVFAQTTLLDLPEYASEEALVRALAEVWLSYLENGAASPLPARVKQG
ncbi:MAG: TetR/AcrR family transcriptional regulator [Acidobacteria bacterium]|nr:TetR/AcrR family transcriptional regulator [Acidobacteriota bacterium]